MPVFYKCDPVRQAYCLEIRLFDTMFNRVISDISVDPQLAVINVR